MRHHHDPSRGGGGPEAALINAADALGVESVDTPAGEVQLTGDWAWVSVYPGLSEALGEEITPDTSMCLFRLRLTIA